MEIRAYSVEQAAEKMSLSTTFVRRLIKNGKLRHVRAGDRILISEKFIDEFLSGESCQPKQGEAR